MAVVPPRGRVTGWSTQSAQRLRRWFYSVDGEKLDGEGVAFTLTVLDLPPAAIDWTSTHRRFLKRLRRSGMVRGQWLTEWQARGVPHLHGCVFFEKGSTGLQKLVGAHWLAAASEWRPGWSGQAVKPLWGLSGWLQYQAKHSARGVRHYQRANVPPSWREGTGRLWGAVGDWPVREELIEVSSQEFWQFRRLLMRWLVGDARRDLAAASNEKKRETARRRLAFLKGYLRDPDRKRSAVRAVGEFCPESVSRELLAIVTLGDLERFEKL